MSDSDPKQPGQRPPQGDATAPTDIKLKRADQQLVIGWRDGHESVLDAVTLRRNCPCAGCREEQQARRRNPLHVLSTVSDQDPALTGAELMGHYALRLVWSDGHDTGIFDYRYLRSLDPN